MSQGIEHIPDDKSRSLVKTLAAVGTRYVDIAHKLGITDDTLRKHYKPELEDGRIDANAQIANTLFQQAKKGNMTAAIFWLKTRAGWKETNVTELSGGEGSEVKGINITFVESNVKPD
jgi:predicted transcriptional regulator